MCEWWSASAWSVPRHCWSLAQSNQSNIWSTRITTLGALFFIRLDDHWPEPGWVGDKILWQEYSSRGQVGISPQCQMKGESAHKTHTLNLPKWYLHISLKFTSLKCFQLWLTNASPSNWIFCRFVRSSEPIHEMVQTALVQSDHGHYRKNSKGFILLQLGFIKPITDYKQYP